MVRVANLIAMSFVFLNSIAAAQELTTTDSQIAEVTQQQRQAAEQTIRKYFPELDDDVLAGWVDAYADLPAQELKQLLLQKSLLPSAGTASTFLSDYTAELPSLSTASQQKYFVAAKTILRNNILHAETLGYRRRKLVTMVTELSAAGDAAAIAITTPDFDFTPAKRSVSPNPLHVALADKVGFGRMFRLEPGGILTRCGRFERLTDGRLGLKIGEQSLALYGDIKIPADVPKIDIDTAGLVTSVTSPAKGKQRTRVEYGQIQVAAIHQMSVLHSHNGVFFQVRPEDMERFVTMTSQVSLISRSLETSNVDVDQEINRLKRIERLER